MEKENIFNEIHKAYSIHGLDLDKAVDVWLDHSLDVSEMRYAIKEDCGRDVTGDFVELLVTRAITSSPNSRFAINYAMLEKLKNSNIVKLTPAIRASIKHIGNNTYKTRFSSSDVSWSIIFIDNVPHLARKDPKETESKFSGMEANERNSD